MSETPTNTTPENENNEVSADEALDQAIAFSHPIAADKEVFEHDVLEASKNLVNQEQVQESHSLDTEASKNNALKTVGVVAAGTALAVGGGALLGNTIDNHVAQVEQNNQQWQEEAEQNQHQVEFEEGLNSGKVTIEVPTSEETTIPSPVQQGDVQLPTLPSPEQKSSNTSPLSNGYSSENVLIDSQEPSAPTPNDTSENESGVTSR